jgi:eukaryotic-like serine/threonine-protein kinase
VQIERLEFPRGATLPFPPPVLHGGARVPMVFASPPAESREPRTLPCQFGRYTLFDHIGRGGMANIYLAKVRTDFGGSRLVVIKEVVPKLADDERFAEMLVSEAKLAATLRHASIAQVEDLGRQGESLFIAMEYVEGLDLRELLRRCARQKVKLPVEFSLLVVGEALRALVYAHRMGAVHRDVSPSNVLLSFEGEIKLCDFGIARAHDLCAVPPYEALQGKAGYMSPEHARGESIDARTDVFAAGILLWELLSGRRMYNVGRGLSKEEAREDLLELAQRAEVPALVTRGLPDEVALHAIVARALAPSCDERYSSAAAMLRDLSVYTAGANLAASPLRFGAWLREHFGGEIVSARRARERALQALELGPPAIIEPIAGPPAPSAVPPVPALIAGPPAPVEKAPPPAAPVEMTAANEPASPWTRALVPSAPARPGLGGIAALAALVVTILAPAVLAAWYLAGR